MRGRKADIVMIGGLATASRGGGHIGIGAGIGVEIERGGGIDTDTGVVKGREIELIATDTSK
jgi:hypothetical protein